MDVRYMYVVMDRLCHNRVTLTLMTSVTKMLT